MAIDMHAAIDRLDALARAMVNTSPDTFPPFSNTPIRVPPMSSVLALCTKSADIAVEASSGDTLQGYAAVWNDATGKPYKDDYGDICYAGSWTDTIRKAEQQRRYTGHAYLLPHLFNHDERELIGGVKTLYEDAKGVVYVSKLAMGVRRAQEVYELARQGMIRTSYKYAALEAPRYGGARHLKKVNVYEISSVTTPANVYTTAYAKSQSDDPLLRRLQDDIQRFLQQAREDRERWERDRRLQEQVAKTMRDIDAFFARVRPR